MLASQRTARSRAKGLCVPRAQRDASSRTNFKFATAVASTLRYGIDHLSKGAVDPTDEPDDEDPDALASGLDD